MTPCTGDAFTDAPRDALPSAPEDLCLAQRMAALEMHPSGNQRVRQSGRSALCATFDMPFVRGRPKDTQNDDACGYIQRSHKGE